MISSASGEEVTTPPLMYAAWMESMVAMSDIIPSFDVFAAFALRWWTASSERLSVFAMSFCTVAPGMMSLASWLKVVLVPRMYALGMCSSESAPLRSSVKVMFMMSSDSCAEVGTLPLMKAPCIEL